MKSNKQKNNAKSEDIGRSHPPGYIKIVEALKTLLNEKDFSSITWAEISRTAGVNDGLIYKYFNNSRNLLLKVLEEYTQDYLEQNESMLKGIDGALNKLRKFIWKLTNALNEDRVISRIFILEVRAYSDYFNSSAFQLIKQYDQIVLNIIKEGIENGEIRDDMEPTHIKRIIFGATEHMCLPGVVFNRKIDPDRYTDDICKTIFPGIINHAMSHG
jgi:TetR/AcrR family fatty acid metabolism transcriptional regulator